MRVSIDHKEKTMGLVFKKTKHAVVVTIQFTEQEQAIIRQRKLNDYVIIKREWDATMKEKAEAHPEHYNHPDMKPPHLFIKDLVKGPDTYVLDTPIEAKQYEARLVEGLKTLKSFIEGNQTVAESKTFEL
jgi:hypothetical protein